MWVCMGPVMRVEIIFMCCSGHFFPRLFFSDYKASVPPLPLISKAINGLVFLVGPALTDDFNEALCHEVFQPPGNTGPGQTRTCAVRTLAEYVFQLLVRHGKALEVYAVVLFVHVTL